MNAPTSKPKILILDDKPQNLYALAQTLKELPVEIIQTTVGAEALALTLDHEFCLAIVDVQMPEMDGYEFVELLRGNSDTASLPVIFVSAIYSDEYHHRKGYDTGAVDFMSKPFVPEILLSKVKVFLDLYEQRVRLQDANHALSVRALQLEISNQVGQQATSILDLDALLTAVVGSIQSKFNYPFVGVWLLSEKQDQITLQVGAGENTKRKTFKPGFTINVDKSQDFMSWITPHKPSSPTENAAMVDDKKISNNGRNIQTELALPLQVGQEMIGALYIQGIATYQFDSQDQMVLQTLANQIAIAIRNARLYELEKNLNRDKDKFFSIISHDLRTPFNGLMNYSQLMIELIDTLTQDDIIEMSRTIHEQAKATYNLLNNLLAWSQIQRGRIKYKPQPIQLSGLAQSTVTLLKEMAENKGIDLAASIDETIFIMADENMIDMVIRNLTSNALKFTSEGGQVLLSAKPAIVNRQMVEVCIKDTGVGISQEDIKKLFKIDSHHTTQGTSQEEGTGLGLILCQEMIIKNGGNIWVESELDKGTAVKFTVPISVSVLVDEGEFVEESKH